MPGYRLQKTTIVLSSASNPGHLVPNRVAEVSEFSNNDFSSQIFISFYSMKINCHKEDRLKEELLYILLPWPPKGTFLGPVSSKDTFINLL